MAAFQRTPISPLFRRTFVLAAALAVACAHSASGQARAMDSGAAGQVVDAETGEPLSNAWIRIEGIPGVAWTDDAGRFALSLPPGQYRASIQHLSYHSTTEGWWISDGVLSVTIALERSPVRLPDEGVIVDPNDVRLGDLLASYRPHGIDPPDVWTEADLQESGAMNMADFILGRLSLVRVPCRLGSHVTQGVDVDDCVRIRGQPRRICVAMDEAALPGGMAVLASYRPRDLARVAAFRGGEFVMVYTKVFAYHAKARNWRPVPLATQMNTYCRRE